MATANITINGRKITTEPGTAVLKIARREGIDIPTLCDHPALTAIGACRICVVEIKGQRNLQTACTFPVADGMEIETESPAVIKARKLVLDLLFSERNHFCPYCEMSGSCELQELGYRYGIDHWAFPTYTKRFPLDATNKYYLMEHNRCVLCGRCIRACDELPANHTLGLGKRGSESMVRADANMPLGESTCISCGTCVQVCPTGALFYKRSAYMGKDSLTDKIKSVCGQCSIGCGMEVVTRGGNVLQIRGDWDAPVNHGLLCKMGRFEPLYDERKRVEEPLLRNKDKLEPISWDNAVQIMAQRIDGVKEKEIGVLVSSCATNEALYLLHKLFCDQLKVSNIGLLNDAAPQIFKKQQSSLAEIAKGDIILVVSTNPAKDQPVASFLVKQALNKGARLIIVDDKENDLTPFAFLSLKTGDINKAIEIAGRASNPIVLYGPAISGNSANAIKQLKKQAQFIIIESGVNTRAAKAFGINGNFSPAGVKLLYILQGEQNLEGKDLLVKVPVSTFKIVQSSYLSELTQGADLVLPAAIWSERTGSLTNTEGFIQNINSAVQPAGQAKSDWEILRILADKLNRGIAFSMDEVSAGLKKLLKGAV
ncbi:MAG: molybdopterin-dependent oxidoreductase [Deltaproteobacteria bacterium]|nr:molybdopterin-dependent oxidoreductase [Deltaproteobacteria bacterium]